MPGANDPDNRRMMKFNGYSSSEIAVKKYRSEYCKSAEAKHGLEFWVYGSPSPKKKMYYISSGVI